MLDAPSIVRTSTTDGLFLHGFYVSGMISRPAFLHIHGFEGNFYENSFVDALAQEISKAGYGFLSVNTRGNGKETDFLTTSGEYKTVGARFELLEDSPKDIDAWIDFLLEKGYDSVFLCGHSLGTYKVLRYALTGSFANNIRKLLLLAPFDKRALLQTYTPAPLEELLKKAQRKVDEGSGDELISKDYEQIVISYKTYVSWYSLDEIGRAFDFSEIDYSFPALRKISMPTKVIVGENDEYFHQSNPKNPDEAVAIMKRFITNFEGTIIKGVGHSFTPKEEELAQEVVNFLQK